MDNENRIDPIRVASRIRQWAVLGSNANLAQYGFQMYIKDGDVNSDGREYLQKGLALFSLLKEGEQVTRSGRITRAHQLAAVNALEPIIPDQGAPVLKAHDINRVVQTIQAILERKRPPTATVRKCLELVFKASDAYADRAFEELDAKERAYLRPSVGRA